MIAFESSHTQYSHLGASCSNMGCIRTKENIAVDTHLIGKVPSSLGSCLLSYLNHSVTPLRTDVDRIRISVVKQIFRITWGLPVQTWVVFEPKRT